MNEAVILSYASALILLYICILVFAALGNKSALVARNLIMGVGVIPGLIGVVYGFSLVFIQTNIGVVLSVLVAWLLLELGALQLTWLIKGGKLTFKK